jgi:putative sigma-54 modulation protein
VQISLTARHFDLTPGLRQFTTQRLEKLQKFANDIHGVHVVVVQEKARYEAEITMNLNGSSLVCTETHAEPGAAIERAADRLEQQLRRLKDRRTDHKARKTGAPPSANGADESDDDLADED